jgi:hypothetical protein
LAIPASISLILHCDFRGDRPAAEFFHELPDRVQYADYYQLIQQPISLAEINVSARTEEGVQPSLPVFAQTKMQQRAYADIEQWIRDVTLMCDNAMQYNIEESLVYRDAQAIKVSNDLSSFAMLSDHRLAVE